jgi:hypothetical protein
MVITKEIESEIKQLYLLGLDYIDIARLLGISGVVVSNVCSNRRWNGKLIGCRICLHFGSNHPKCSKCSCIVHKEEDVKNISHFKDYKVWNKSTRARRLGLYELVNNKPVCTYCLEWEANKNKKAELFIPIF